MWSGMIHAKSRSTIHRESIPQAGRSKDENLEEMKPNPPLEGEKMKRIEMEVSGGCQCGAVRYRASAPEGLGIGKLYHLYRISLQYVWRKQMRIFNGFSQLHRPEVKTTVSR